MEAVLEEGTKIQVQAAFGAAGLDEEPVRAGGLVASSDGLRWARATDVDPVAVPEPA